MSHIRRIWVKGLIAAGGGLILFALAAVPVFAPAVAAYACPGCYGLEKLDDRVFVESAMSDNDRKSLLSAIEQAAARVAGFYGSFDRQPTLLVCATQDCDRRLGGKGAKAVTHGSVFIRVSPDGRNTTILAHEFSHIVFRSRIGDAQMLLGTIPAWFNEGVAVIVSQDERYLAKDQAGRFLCIAEAVDDLPTGKREWARQATRSTQQIYAQAACKALHWLEANGGPQGLLDVLSRLDQDGFPIN